MSNASFSIQINSKSADYGTHLGEISGKYLHQFMRDVTEETARETLRDEQKKGFDKDPRKRVDNKWDRNENTVRFPGKIQYYSKLSIDEALLETLSLIEKRSPRVTGMYQSGNHVYFNNQLIAKNVFELKAWLKTAVIKDGDFIRFINVRPYAAPLEYKGIRRGTTGSSKGMNLRKARVSKVKTRTVKRPNGAYQLASLAVRRKYKSIGQFVKFSWHINGGGGVNISPTARFRSSYSPDNKKYSGPYTYPSIVFKIDTRGLR